MGTKSGITLDIGAMCNIATEATQFANEITDRISSIQAQVARYQEEGILSGSGNANGTAEHIQEALAEVENNAKAVIDVVLAIKELVTKQINNMATACTANPNLQGALEQLTETKKKIAAIDAKSNAKGGSKK